MNAKQEEFLTKAAESMQDFPLVYVEEEVRRLKDIITKFNKIDPSPDPDYWLEYYFDEISRGESVQTVDKTLTHEQAKSILFDTMKNDVTNHTSDFPLDMYYDSGSYYRQGPRKWVIRQR